MKFKIKVYYSALKYYEYFKILLNEPVLINGSHYRSVTSFGNRDILTFSYLKEGVPFEQEVVLDKVAALNFKFNGSFYIIKNHDFKNVDIKPNVDKVLA